MDNPDWVPTALDLLIGYKPGMDLPQRSDHWRFQSWSPDDHCKSHMRNTEDKHWYWLVSQENKNRWQTLCGDILKREVAAELLAEARPKVRRLIERGALILDNLENDAAKERAELALAVSTAILVDGKTPAKDRLAAARLLLDFSASKPAAKQDVTIKTAEDWLDALDA